jgi:hypothetical protein
MAINAHTKLPLSVFENFIFNRITKPVGIGKVTNAISAIAKLTRGLTFGAVRVIIDNN